MMRAGTRVDYAERIERVVRHLENADMSAGVPDLAELAGVAALSPFHFNRVFRLMTGETPADAVRRIRLARALPVLDAEGVTPAAMEGGYASSQAFARAIRAAAAMSPREAGASPEARARLGEVLGRAGGADAALSIEVVSTAPFRLAAVRNVGGYAELNGGYERLFEAVFATVPMDDLRGVHGIPEDDPRFTAPERYRFTCAVDIGEGPVPAGVEALAIAGGRHLWLRHVGDYERLLGHEDLIYAVALAEGWRLADAPMRMHYLDTPEDAPPEALRTDIYLPIEEDDPCDA